MRTDTNKLVLFAASICLASSAWAISPNPDADAALIRLKLNDCSDKNCFTDVGEMLDWVWNTRKPSQSTPLIIDVSPGTYSVPDRLFCSTPDRELPTMRGHITVRGSGQKNTVLTGGHSDTKAVVALSHCTNLDFQDIAVRSDSRRGVNNGSVNAIYWTNATGKSTWTNVHADATQFAWFDACETQVSNKGLNHWFASRLESRKTSYASSCAANWIFGSELLSRYDDPTITSGRRIVEADASNGNTGAVWMFGVTVRSETEADGPGATDAQVGVYARNGGAIHVHGGIISLRHDNPNNGVDVIPVQSVGAGAFIHAPGAAYALRATGSGIVRRVVMEDGGVAMTPFMWQALSAPPPIESAQGQDVVVETDCSASGCQTVGNEPHMLVYSEACAGGSGGPWFDVVTGSCR